MRQRQISFRPWIATCLLAIVTFTSPSMIFAQKGGKGGGNGGGGNDGGGTLPPVEYKVELFSGPGTFVVGAVHDINNRGQCVGRLASDDGRDRGFLYDRLLDNGVAVELNQIVSGIPNGYSIRQARAINEAGDIAAYLDPIATPGQFLQAVMIDMNDEGTAGVCHVIPDRGISDYSVALDLNDHGDLAVRYRQPNGTWGIYHFNFGNVNADLATTEPVDLGAISASSHLAINNLRQVIFVEQEIATVRATIDGGVEVFPELASAVVRSANDFGEFCGSVTVQSAKGKSRSQSYPYIFGTELTTYDLSGTALDLNLASDFVADGYLYHQAWGQLTWEDLMALANPDDDATVALENAAGVRYIDVLTDRDDATGFPVIAGIMARDGGKGFLLVPQPLP